MTEFALVNSIESVEHTTTTTMTRASNNHKKDGNRKSLEEKWMEHFLELSRYKEKYGHCNVPYGDKRFKSLGYWVSDQRSNRKNGKLSESRMEKLDSIGFEWDRTWWCTKGTKHFRDDAKASKISTPSHQLEDNASMNMPTHRTDL